MRKSTPTTSTEDKAKKTTKARTLRKPSTNKTTTRKKNVKNTEVNDSEETNDVQSTIPSLPAEPSSEAVAGTTDTPKKRTNKRVVKNTRKTNSSKKATESNDETEATTVDTTTATIQQAEVSVEAASTDAEATSYKTAPAQPVVTETVENNASTESQDTTSASTETENTANNDDTASANRYEKKVRQEQKIMPLPQTTIHDIVELAAAPMRAIILTDQQIQQLTLEEIEKRHDFLQNTLANVLDYDVVISDTNIWLELLVGHTSSHSDPRYNARLQFERQLEFISKLTKYRGGRFMMMSETYEEIDRFACMQDPTNHREADFTDNMVCLNAAARLAKRLILSQQRENRLRIDNISAESHHASFADPAIIHRVAELFAEGKKVLLLTNDASVAIRSIGICDDLQRHNNISDEEWSEKYAPLRPMVFTFDDLKLLDYYTRQYHYIQMASGKSWMCDVERTMKRTAVPTLTLWEDAFRPGDKHRGDNLFTEQEQKQILQKQQQNAKLTAKKQPQQAKSEPKNDVINEQSIAEPAKTEQKSAPKAQQRKTSSKRKNTNRTSSNGRKTPENEAKTTDNA